jgi:hypothetical protein
MLRPWPVPAELAADVARLEASGFRTARFCPRRCPQHGKLHVHMLTPDGKAMIVTAPGEPPRGRLCHVYFTPYAEFGPVPADALLEMEAPAVPVLVRAIGYQDRGDHVVSGDDRIVIYYEVPGAVR